MEKGRSSETIGGNPIKPGSWWRDALVGELKEIFISDRAKHIYTDVVTALVSTVSTAIIIDRLGADSLTTAAFAAGATVTSALLKEYRVLRRPSEFIEKRLRIR